MNRFAMRKESDSDLKYLRWYVSRGISYAHGRGYLWFKERFLPSLARLENKRKHSQLEKTLLTEACYLLGDIHDFNDAPKQALKAYKKSISHFPFSTYASGPWRELGSMQLRLGQYATAVKALQRAVKICPSDSFAQSDLELALEVKENRSEPECDLKEPLTKARDLLARQEVGKALKTIEKCELNSETRLLRACCFGQLLDAEAYMNEWTAIATAKDFVYLNYVDWFYMPDGVNDKAQLWKLMLKVAEKERFISSAFVDCGVLFDYHPLPHSIPFEDSKHRAPTNLAYGEMCRYQIALIEDELQTLNSLATKYPKWAQARDGIKRMKSY